LTGHEEEGAIWLWRISGNVVVLKVWEVLELKGLFKFMGMGEGVVDD